jgi:chlorobactene glucosyltransferase
MAWFTEAPWWQVNLLISYAALVLVVYLRQLVVSFERKHARFLTQKSPRFSGEPPLVSILVPAKDEAGQIENCLKSLCAQDYPNFEILVVDDRSSDDTAAIVARCAEKDSRIHLLRIRELPAGWTGKTHALHKCQQRARGEWLFFVDSDTQMHPSCLSIVLRDCSESGADVESLLPALASDSLWVRILQPMALALLVLLYRPSRVNGSGSTASGMTNGQFILIRREAYRKIGGHEAVKGEFCEDIHIGRNVRQQGLRLRIVVATDIAVVKMYSTAKAFFAGWSRIFYSIVDTRAARLWGLAALLCVFSVLPYVVMLASAGALLMGASSFFVQAALCLALAQEFCQWIFYRRVFLLSGTSLRYLPTRILSVLAMLHVLGKAIRTCRTHEVNWRGTSYTSELRRDDARRRAA